MPVFTFHHVWDRASLVVIATYSRLAGLGLLGICLSFCLLPHYSSEVVNVCFSSSLYTWALGIWTQVFSLTWQVHYLLGHYLTPHFLSGMALFPPHHNAVKALGPWGFPILWISLVGKAGTQCAVFTPCCSLWAHTTPLKQSLRCVKTGANLVLMLYLPRGSMHGEPTAELVPSCSTIRNSLNA